MHSSHASHASHAVSNGLCYLFLKECYYVGTPPLIVENKGVRGVKGWGSKGGGLAFFSEGGGGIF
jgi:hypothetical protein